METMADGTDARPSGLSGLVLLPRGFTLLGRGAGSQAYTYARYPFRPAQAVALSRSKRAGRLGSEGGRPATEELETREDTSQAARLFCFMLGLAGAVLFLGASLRRNAMLCLIRLMMVEGSLNLTACSSVSWDLSASSMAQQHSMLIARLVNRGHHVLIMLACFSHGEGDCHWRDGLDIIS
ncbi:hypothetical protein B0T24DRAFT_158524 [Lasiosphaeria ovina]|uniref:Uncharacterized protein n=1 Tax=Lasiosphaeria ovina TaxID=92902 RepID=A0AAE0NDL3_9PEZI|nr:hypothetical protein B0T24DRAFT_158524 [Lasiosphaeria ovina]